MMKNFTPKIVSFFFVSCFFFSTSLNAQTGCPGCISIVPGTLSEDTFYIAPIPDATKGQVYEEDMGFRMPKTTSPIAAQDPSVPAGINLDEIKVNSISGLPPGMEWTTDKTSYDPGDDTDGCLRICGTPLVSGMFQVAINATARVAFISTDATFKLDMYVAPSISTTDGFTLINNEDCGMAVVSFENNIPSNGLDGFSYIWDLGNGLTTTDENPIEQVYDTPGVYYVTYQAVVDTTGFILSHIELLDLDCSDLFSGPDVVVTIKDPNGEVIYESREYENTDVPFAIDLNVPIGDGNYQIKAKDLDSGLEFGDKTCAESSFNKFSSTLDGNGFELELTIIHPIDTINARDSIIVYPEPSPPIINLPSSELFFCEGDTLLLVSSYDQGNQWYINGFEIAGATVAELPITQGGIYSLVYTDPNGCQAASDEVMIDVYLRPDEPVFENFENVLSLVDTSALPTDYRLQWILNGYPLFGETGFSICITESGDYGLWVTDKNTGCTNEYLASEIYDPEFNCLSTNTEELTWVEDIQVYPNPNDGIFQVSFGASLPDDIHIRLINVAGILIDERVVAAGISQPQQYQHTELPAGLYFLVIENALDRITKKVIVK